jgi:galactokinase
MKLDNEQALKLHQHRFGQQGKPFAAPARVNLIGEHTDYTGGLVMPMAIGFRTVAVISKGQDDRAVFYSANYEEEVSLEVSALERAPAGRWSDYPTGVLWSLQQRGIPVSGFNMTLSGDVPLGAGLSSSASLATLCRQAENEYVGAKSGIMDQFVVAGAEAHRAMLLDCRSLTFELLPLPDQVCVVICNSMVQHAVATGEYGDRRDEVESGQAVLQRERPNIKLLRDATLEDLEACKDKMSPASFARCRHIITENHRVLKAREALLHEDMKQFGSLMVEAHKSMRDDFAASCEEVDMLVEIAMQQPECFGARITGGGFGGCTVNIVGAEYAEQFVSATKKEYAAKTGITAQCFVNAPTDGALALAANGGAQ